MTDWRIKHIFAHYGKEHQLEKLLEEAYELQEATRNLLWLIKAYQCADKDERIEKAVDHLAEEISDVRIMCEQIEHGLGIYGKCDYQRKYKLERQIERINEEKNND